MEVRFKGGGGVIRSICVRTCDIIRAECIKMFPEPLYPSRLWRLWECCPSRRRLSAAIGEGEKWASSIDNLTSCVGRVSENLGHRYCEPLTSVVHQTALLPSESYTVPRNDCHVITSTIDADDVVRFHITMPVR